MKSVWRSHRLQVLPSDCEGQVGLMCPTRSVPLLQYSSSSHTSRDCRVAGAASSDESSTAAKSAEGCRQSLCYGYMLAQHGTAQPQHSSVQHTTAVGSAARHSASLAQGIARGVVVHCSTEREKTQSREAQQYGGAKLSGPKQWRAVSTRFELPTNKR